MGELTQLRVMQVEHEKWRDLCKQLEETGAVTRSDLESVAAAQDTPGQRLIEAIRVWGESLAVLRAEVDA